MRNLTNLYRPEDVSVAVYTEGVLVIDYLGASVNLSSPFSSTWVFCATSLVSLITFIPLYTMSTPPEITLSSSGEAIDTPINPSIQLPSPVASTPGSSFSPKSPTSPKRHPHFPADHALTLPMPSTRANSNPDIEPITRGSHAPSLMTSRPSTRKRPASAGTDTALKINLTHIPKNIFNTVKSAVEILSHSRIFGTKERENVNVWVGTWNMNGRVELI